MKRARVLLADDHAPIAEQLRALLESQFEVVATVTDGFALVGAAAALKPDVIVSDISMPGMDGIAAATLILKSDPAARIVFVTVHREPPLMRRAMELGVLGYVLKLAAAEELLPAVENALQGQKYISTLLGSSDAH